MPKHPFTFSRLSSKVLNKLWVLIPSAIKETRSHEALRMGKLSLSRHQQCDTAVGRRARDLFPYFSLFTPSAHMRISHSVSESIPPPHSRTRKL